MSRKCDVCGRGPQVALKRSHSNIGTKRRQLLNLQAKKMDGKKKKVCTKCLRTMSKTK